MIGGFISRGLILVLAYAYPAFECFKAVENNGVEVQELRFWCQYWIIIAMLTALERIADIFVSWWPMYGELKLALFIYLWYPKTKGAGYVYQTYLRPYVSKHEMDIDWGLQELRERAWNLATYHWQICLQLVSAKIPQFIQFMTSQSVRIKQPGSQNGENQHSYETPPPTSSPTSTPSRLVKRNKTDREQLPNTPSGKPTSQHA
ncbi:putative HVA22-like protein g [Olea europaea var. sylvestris]|uniref:HVA22-like protein n=1 Tax=Olea europaea subsp. europaea TaxID=158383 RepID=A0A8S0TXS4_OLEEU|nr:putative HVA22-like protein g [Olea europaea var. sylvestris]CAA3009759.1 HVA22 g [Olea europaea subsp. europaea]